MIELKFKRMFADVQLPRRATPGSVGWDVYAYLISETGRRSKRNIAPRTTLNMKTGLLIEPPPDHFVMVCSRSGLASHSVIVMNAPGIIDPDYRGELQALLYNGSYETQWIEHGDRIAQLFLMPVVPMRVVDVDDLTSTERGGSGFGSTGR